MILMMVGFIGFGGLYYFAPDFYFSLYPLIPLCFMLILTGIYFTLFIFQKRKSGIDMKSFAIIKTIKILLCLVFVWAYCKIIDSNNMSFAIVFMLFYVVSLALESWLFMQISKYK
jgi:hypothetical protein